MMSRRKGFRRLRLPKSRREFFDTAAYALFALVAVIVTIPFFVIILDIVIKGAPGLSPSLFLENISQLGLQGGIRNAIVGTLELVGIASAVAIPLGVGAAVYTAEFARQGRMQQVVELTADIMAGVPSIVFGAFGYVFFVWILGFGYSLIAGALTLALMMMPTILRTTQESLRYVPQDLREASLALGATRWSTTWRVTLRACFPAIMTGILLSLARAAGETAPLIFTTGYNAGSPWGIFDAVASLPFTIYSFATHPSPIVNQKAYTASLVLILIVLVVDLAANWASRRIGMKIRKD